MRFIPTSGIPQNVDIEKLKEWVTNQPFGFISSQVTKSTLDPEATLYDNLNNLHKAIIGTNCVTEQKEVRLFVKRSLERWLVSHCIDYEIGYDYSDDGHVTIFRLPGIDFLIYPYAGTFGDILAVDKWLEIEWSSKP